MACHTPTLEKVRNKGKCYYPSSVPSHSEDVEFRDWMGQRMGNGISPCFFALSGGAQSVLIFLLLSCFLSF